MTSTLAMNNAQKLLTLYLFMLVYIENKLLIEHAQLITQFENEIDEYPEHVYMCCSCECLYQRKSVVKVKLADKLGNGVWSR